MTIDGFGFDKEPKTDSLVPGSMIGYRQYSWDGHNFHSANTTFSVKLKADENVAVCKRKILKDTEHAHEAPGRTCHCGFYGWYDPFNIENTGVANAISNTSVLAAVEVWGRVILGTKGFRAQKLRVKGVVPPQWLVADRNQEHYFAWIEQVEKLGAEVFPTLMDMMMKYPKPDVKDLLPEGMQVEDPTKKDDGQKLMAAQNAFTNYVSGTVNVPAGNFTVAQLDAIINQMGMSFNEQPPLETTLTSSEPIHPGSAWVQAIYDDANKRFSRTHHITGDYYQLMNARTMVESMIRDSVVASYGNVRISDFNVDYPDLRPFLGMANPYEMPSTRRGVMTVRVGR